MNLTTGDVPDIFLLKNSATPARTDVLRPCDSAPHCLTPPPATPECVLNCPPILSKKAIKIKEWFDPYLPSQLGLLASSSTKLNGEAIVKYSFFPFTVGF